MRHFHFVAAGLLAFTLAAHADVVYSFVGLDFQSLVSGSPYNTPHHVTGFIYLPIGADPLPDQGYEEYASTNFLFTDGLQTLTNLNATASFQFNTGNVGQINFFYLDVRSLSGPASIYVQRSPTRQETTVTLADGSSAHNNASGVLTLAPEPSSFVLLGTGVLGAAGVLRRRLVSTT